MKNEQLEKMLENVNSQMEDGCMMLNEEQADDLYGGFFDTNCNPSCNPSCNPGCTC